MTTTWTCWRDPHHTTETTKFGWPQCSQCGAAPAYHERFNAIPDTFTLNVYVPTDPRSLAMIARHSGVVGMPGEGDWIDTYYEGWTLGQYTDLEPRARWEHGILHATDRMVTNYPTIARAHLPHDTLTQVGTYAPKTKTLDITDPKALNTWLK